MSKKDEAQVGSLGAMMRLRHKSIKDYASVSTRSRAMR